MKTVLFLLLFICTLTPGCKFSVSTGSNKDQPVMTAGTEAQNREAFDAAEGILRAIDDGHYDEVYEGSSHLLKDTSPKFAFTGMLSLIRKDMGAPSPRDGAAIGFTDKIDDSIPKGEFSVVEVDTIFGKKVLHEKVVMAKESGAWKLAGYFVNTRFQ